MNICEENSESNTSDYGDINLESILRGYGNENASKEHYSNENQPKLQSNSFEKPTARNSSVSGSLSMFKREDPIDDIDIADDNFPRDKEIHTIMNEFHKLMKEIDKDHLLNSQQRNSHFERNENLLISQKSHRSADGYGIGSTESQYTHDTELLRPKLDTSNTEEYLRLEKKIVDYVKREDSGDVETNLNFLLMSGNRPESRKDSTPESERGRDIVQKMVDDRKHHNFQTQLPKNEDRRHREPSPAGSTDSVDSKDSLGSAPSPLIPQEDNVLLRSNQNSNDWASTYSASAPPLPYNVLSSVKSALNSRTSLQRESNNSISTRESFSEPSIRKHESDSERNDTFENKYSIGIRTEPIAEGIPRKEGGEALGIDRESTNAQSLLQLYRSIGDGKASQSLDAKRVSFQQQPSPVSLSGKEQQPQTQPRLSSSYTDSSFLLHGPNQNDDSKRESGKLGALLFLHVNS